MEPREDNSIITKRYGVIDALRGLAVLSMVGFHLCYDILCVFGGSIEFFISLPGVLWARATCCTFIVVSGMSMNFTRRGYKRGLALNLLGLVVTAATVIFIPSQAIWFGVLNLLGCSMLIACALRNALDRVSPVAGMAVSLPLFAVLYGLPRGYLGLPGLSLIRLPDQLYRFRPLTVIGLPDKDFVSADYFPILPWIFLFLFGYFLWRSIARRGYDRFFDPKIPALGFIGRHSLLIYMLHQPVLYGICWVILR